MKSSSRISILFLAMLISALMLAGCSSKGGGNQSDPTPQVEDTFINDDQDNSSEIPEIFGPPPVDAGDENTGDDPMPPAQDGSNTPVNPEPITLVFGGDVMLSRNVEGMVNNKGNGDYRYPWLKVADYLKKADVAFVNLESQITNKGTLNLAKSAPWFRTDPKAVEGLQYAGIDIVSVANNHVFDYGRDGMEDSLKNLTNAGIKYCGGGLTYAEAYTPTYITAKGKKIAFLAYTNHGDPSWRAQVEYTDEYGVTYPACSGVSWLYIKQLERGIFKARADGANLIVVSIHFGTDYTTLPSSAQDRYAHLALDRGADIVIGHGPHVTQPTMVYHKRHIAYSLGNFIFDQHEAYQKGVTSGKVLEVTWANGGVQKVTERRTKISETTWQPEFIQ